MAAKFVALMYISIGVANAQLLCDPGHLTGGLCQPVRGDAGPCRDIDYCVEECFGSSATDAIETSHKSCPVSQVDGHVKSPDVTYKLIPVNYNNFNLSFQLPNSSNRYVVTKRRGDDDSEQECYYSTKSSSTFNITILYPKERLNYTIKVLMSSESEKYSEIFRELISIPRNCMDDEISYDQDTCALPQLQPPTNTNLQCNKSHTLISWERRLYYIHPNSTKRVYTDPQNFYVDVDLDGGLKLKFVVVNSSSISLNTTAAMNVTIRGYHKCSRLLETSRPPRPPGYSPPAVINSTSPGTCCSNSTCGNVSSATLYSYSSSPSFSNTPSSPLNNNPDSQDTTFIKITVILTIVVLTVATILTLIVVLLIRRGVVCPPLPEQVAPELLQRPSGLAIYSPNTPEQEKHIIMQSFAGLASLQETRPPQDSLVSWLNEHFNKAETIFCVCNKEFMNDWHSKQPSPEVQILKLMFEGNFSSGKSKEYVVVLTKPSDKKFIPSLLKTLPCVNLFDDTSFEKCQRV